MQHVLVACLSFCFVHFSTCIFTLVEHVVIILELTKIYLAFNVYYVGKERPNKCVRFERRGKDEKIITKQRTQKEGKLEFTCFSLTYYQQCDDFVGVFSLEILTLRGPRGPSWALRFHRNVFKVTSRCFRLKVSKLTSSESQPFYRMRFPNGDMQTCITNLEEI